MCHGVIIVEYIRSVSAVYLTGYDPTIKNHAVLTRALAIYIMANEHDAQTHFHTSGVSQGAMFVYIKTPLHTPQTQSPISSPVP